MLSQPPSSTKPGKRTTCETTRTRRTHFRSGKSEETDEKSQARCVGTQWFLTALEADVRQQMGFYGGLGGLQDSPHHQVHHARRRAHQVDHLGVAHVAHAFLLCSTGLVLKASSTSSSPSVLSL
ncbi:hypothetical protein EYF80_036424 [Liparis tanakae]|uniref:Uncharacterized protein n=1 Tax=Liparis tanakae TaxID=230148 RepID=A0A4Z2GIN8_9TELE|nr:hypothetical protein EYF80_036424 [Liparis tanakae]